MPSRIIRVVTRRLTLWATLGAVKPGTRYIV